LCVRIGGEYFFRCPEFIVVGSKVTDEIRALQQPDNGIIIKGFVSEEELSELYATCRVVVVPLRYGAGVKGKVVDANKEAIIGAKRILYKSTARICP
jgi:glycosyltransferase involved in cell wall biosynthesis